MNKLYTRLQQLTKALANQNLTEDERYSIEDEIADIEFELEEQENEKYNNYDSEE